MPRRLTLDEEIDLRRAENGLPPRVKIERKRQKNPHRLKIAPRPEDSPVTKASPTTHDSPTARDRATKRSPLALPPESPSTDDSPIITDSPRAERATEYRAGDSRVNHDFFDDRLCGLDPLAQLLYFHLNRYRQGASNFTVIVSWKRLGERIPVSESTLRRAYVRLNQAGLAFKEKEVYRKGGGQGIIFRVVTGASPGVSDSPSTGDTHKSNNIKANLKEMVTSCDKCRDTGGFIYPSGIGGGVLKCKHE